MHGNVWDVGPLHLFAFSFELDALILMILNNNSGLHTQNKWCGKHSSFYCLRNNYSVGSLFLKWGFATGAIQSTTVRERAKG